MRRPVVVSAIPDAVGRWEVDDHNKEDRDDGPKKNYVSANATETCILENAWLDQKDKLFSQFILRYFDRMFPSEIIHRILAMVEVWRAIDAVKLDHGFFKIELRRTYMELSH